jgi:hypothetical protein
MICSGVMTCRGLAAGDVIEVRKILSQTSGSKASSLAAAASRVVFENILLAFFFIRMY